MWSASATPELSMDVRAKPSTKDPGQQPTASSGFKHTTIASTYRSHTGRPQGNKPHDERGCWALGHDLVWPLTSLPCFQAKALPCVRQKQCCSKGQRPPSMSEKKEWNLLALLHKVPSAWQVTHITANSWQLPQLLRQFLDLFLLFHIFLILFCISEHFLRDHPPCPTSVPSVVWPPSQCLWYTCMHCSVH